MNWTIWLVLLLSLKKIKYHAVHGKQIFIVKKGEELLDNRANI